MRGRAFFQLLGAFALVILVAVAIPGRYAAAGAAFGVAIILAAILARISTQRRQKIRHFADRIAAGDFSARIAEVSSDEIGEAAWALDRSAEKLQSSSAEIEHLEKARRDFIANVSHELRTPLTSIQGYTETLSDSNLSQMDREFLETIRRNAQRMSRLTEDLLLLARVESGEQNFSFVPVPATDLLHEAHASLRAMAEAKAVELSIEQVAPRMVMADREAVHQVFANLIDNALKYGHAGKRVEIGAREIEDGVEFYVRDFGQGIAREHLTRIFERFYRIDKARSRESGGTGLGLAIVKHIVLQHGGAVRAVGELGHGATFFFTLPMFVPSLPHS